MKEKIAVYLLKLSLWILPLTPKGHKVVEPIINGWVDKLNKTYYKNFD